MSKLVIEVDLEKEDSPLTISQAVMTELINMVDWWAGSKLDSGSPIYKEYNDRDIIACRGKSLYKSIGSWRIE